MNRLSVPFALAVAGLVASGGVLSSCAAKSATSWASGTFESREIIVSSEATGKILRLDAAEGYSLVRDQLVGEIDSVQSVLKRDQLKAGKKALQSRRPDVAVQIATLEQQVSTAKSEQLRVGNLLKAGAANQQQLDDANAQLALLERQLAAQRSTLSGSDRALVDEIASLDIQIAQIDDLLAKCRILSPIDGTVLVSYAEQGELATVGRALFKIADLGSMYLRAYVVASQLTTLKLGQKVRVFSDFGGEGDREYAGTISWIADKAEFTPKAVQTRDERANLVYAVKVAVKNDGYLKIGMYGRLETGE